MVRRASPALHLAQPIPWSLSSQTQCNMTEEKEAPLKNLLWAKSKWNSAHLYRHSLWDSLSPLCINRILIGRNSVRLQPTEDEHPHGILTFPPPDTSPLPRAPPAFPDKPEQFTSWSVAGAKCRDLHPQPDNLSHCWKTVQGSTWDQTCHFPCQNESYKF